MTKPKTEADCGIGPFWKVRVFFTGGGLHLASRTEPVLHMQDDGKLARVDLDLIEGTEHGDTVGFIDWSAVVTISWRKAEPEAPVITVKHLQKARGRPRPEPTLMSQ